MANVPSFRRSYFRTSGEGIIGFQTDVRAGELVLVFYVSKDFPIRPSSIPEGYSTLVNQAVDDYRYLAVLAKEPVDHDTTESVELYPDDFSEHLAFGALYTVTDIDLDDPILAVGNETLTSGDLGGYHNMPDPTASGFGKQLFFRTSLSESVPYASNQSPVWITSQAEGGVTNEFYRPTHAIFNMSPYNEGYYFDAVERRELVDYDDETPPTPGPWISEGTGASLLTLVLRPGELPEPPEDPEEPDDQDEPDSCNKTINITINCCKE